MSKNRARFALSAIYLALIILCAGWAQAQTHQLPLGQVNLPVKSVKSVKCTFGFLPGTACYSSTVTCPGTVDIGFTYGVMNPGGSQGTVVFFNGENGTGVGFEQYVKAYTPPALDFQTVQVIWSSAWEDTSHGNGVSLKTAACRPATLMDWLLRQRNVYAGGGMCAQGASGGSAAIAYAMAEYGAYQYLNHAELESGPVMSDVSIGCNPSSKPVTVCPGNECQTGGQGSWSDSPLYVDGSQTSISTWTNAMGSNACVAGGNRISQAQYNAWKSMSIVDGITGSKADSTFAYPRTSISGWLCSKPPGCNGSACQNSSAAQGQFFYQNVTTPISVYRVNACNGTEGVEDGTVPQLGNEPGLEAIITSMATRCVAPRH
jgi:hypothetical protein